MKKTVFVRRWNSSTWEKITETAWRKAEQEAGAQSAFAETRDEDPNQ